MPQTKKQENRRTLHNGRVQIRRMQRRWVVKLHGLSGLQEISNGNILRPTISLNQRNLYMGKFS